MYEYKATVVRVIDGDTVDADVDVGFYATLRLRLRFVGIDTPELTSRDAAEREKALKAKDYVERVLLSDPKPSVVIKTSKSDSFGRWLADITYTSAGVSKNLNEELLGQGLAVKFR